MERSRIALVIPAFNESSTIFEIVKKASKVGIPIVVDDGSSDNTGQLAIDAGAYLVSHDRNMGYDAALSTGFGKAVNLGAEVIVTLDGDGQHHPEILKNFIDLIDSGCDVVVGSRNKKSRIAEYIFALYTNFFYGIKDPLCGMKAYKSELYLEQGYFDNYKSVGTQLMMFAAKKGYRIGQVDFHVGERDGLTRFGSGLFANYNILKALIKGLFFI